MASEAEVAAMRRAITLAARGIPGTRPNPPVGAVVLDAAGEVAGEGWHRRAGGPHAEVAALAAAGERARGGTVVVTLEPCNHTGRTGPCAAALLAAGVARVVYAVPDPTTRAAGGAAALAAAGADVEAGLLAAEAERANAVWLTWARLGRPHVSWKYAASLDGRVAAADGASRWVTSAAAREDAQRLRAVVDAIVVGAGTVAADDPHLTARTVDGALATRQPLRVVVDSGGRTDAGARVRDAAAPTWLATADEVGAGPDGRVDVAKLLAALGGRGVQAVLLEGGPRLAASFLAAGLVDRVIGYVAPLVLGAGLPLVGDVGVPTLAAGLRFVVDEVVPVGPDVRITAHPARPGPAGGNDFVPPHDDGNG